MEGTAEAKATRLHAFDDADLEGPRYPVFVRM